MYLPQLKYVLTKLFKILAFVCLESSLAKNLCVRFKFESFPLPCKNVTLRLLSLKIILEKSQNLNKLGSMILTLYRKCDY